MVACRVEQAVWIAEQVRTFRIERGTFSHRLGFYPRSQKELTLAPGSCDMISNQLED